MLERHDRQFHELYCVEHYRKGSGELEWPMQTLVMANSEEDAIELVKAWHDGLTGGQELVSCFSVLHHFVMGRGTSSAKELMRLLAARTGRVLFLDTGQAHESWFRWTLLLSDPAQTADPNEYVYTTEIAIRKFPHAL